MNNKRRLHHALVVVRRLKVWQLLVILIIMMFASATLLRLNNLEMVQLRTAVEKADEAGDTAAIHTALVNLQGYVFAHMNTGLDKGIYLQHSYDRARDAALEAANNAAANPNSAIYQQASVECRSRFVGGVASFRNDYVQCVIDRVGSLSPSSDPLANLKLPQASLYHYDFISPLWTPDFAGFAVFITGVMLAIIIMRLLIAGGLMLALRLRHSRIK